jgi:hypothetical protein
VTVAVNPLSAQTAAVCRCVSCLNDPATRQYILKEYIPAFRFGCLAAPEAVSVGINPAENECGSRPLPLLSDHRRAERTKLDHRNLDEISKRHDQYFSQHDAHPFFGHLQKILWTINPKWTYGSRAAHIDLVSCVTDPTWSLIAGAGREGLLKNCYEHFLNTVRLLPPNCWILCDGATALNSTLAAGGSVWMQDMVGRVKILAGTLTLAGDTIRFAGWNYPAHKVRSDEQKREIGAAVRSAIKSTSA